MHVCRLRYELLGLDRIYGQYFFPVYELATDGGGSGSGEAIVPNQTADCCGVLVSFSMLVLWSFWCAVTPGVHTQGGSTLYNSHA